MDDARLTDEAARIGALRRYEVLDTPPERPFDRITATVCQALDVPRAAVSLVDTDRQWLKSRFGPMSPQTPREMAFCAQTIGGRDVLVVADAQRDARFSANPLVTGAPHIRSYAGAPLMTPDGYNIGALCAIDLVPRAFTPAQLDLLEHFAGLVVGELELRQIAGQDHLTGALTRRGFLSALEAEIAVRDAIGAQATLMIFDLDHFKAINDRYGHGAGDAVLRCVIETCRMELRGVGIIGRLGGEEFGVVLPRTTPAAGAETARRLCAAIAATSVGLPLSITASFGVQALRPPIATAAEWLKTADAAMYAAKLGGRNRCVIAPFPHPALAA